MNILSYCWPRTASYSPASSQVSASSPPASSRVSASSPPANDGTRLLGSELESGNFSRSGRSRTDGNAFLSAQAYRFAFPPTLPPPQNRNSRWSFVSDKVNGFSSHLNNIGSFLHGTFFYAITRQEVTKTLFKVFGGVAALKLPTNIVRLILDVSQNRQNEFKVILKKLLPTLNEIATNILVIRATLMESKTAPQEFSAVLIDHLLISVGRILHLCYDPYTGSEGTKNNIFYSATHLCSFILNLTALIAILSPEPGNILERSMSICVPVDNKYMACSIPPDLTDWQTVAANFTAIAGFFNAIVIPFLN